MQELLSSPVFQVYVGSTTALILNLLFLANGTALSRAGSKEVVNPEDKKLGPNKDAKIVTAEGSADKVLRFQRAHRNALENVPMFMISSLLLPLAGVDFLTSAILCGVFVAFRWLHSIAYIGSMQPFRTLSFAIGMLAQVALLVFVCIKVFA
jgi:prostaglandin-E synthase 1